MKKFFIVFTLFIFVFIVFIQCSTTNDDNNNNNSDTATQSTNIIYMFDQNAKRIGSYDLDKNTLITNLYTLSGTPTDIKSYDGTIYVSHGNYISYFKPGYTSLSNYTVDSSAAGCQFFIKENSLIYFTMSDYVSSSYYIGIFDTLTKTVTKKSNIAGPSDFEIIGNKIYAVSSPYGGAASVKVLDKESLHTLSTISIRSNSYGNVMDTDGTKIFVLSQGPLDANWVPKGGMISIISNDNLVRTISIGDDANSSLTYAPITKKLFFAYKNIGFGVYDLTTSQLTYNTNSPLFQPLNENREFFSVINYDGIEYLVSGNGYAGGTNTIIFRTDTYSMLHSVAMGSSGWTGNAFYSSELKLSPKVKTYIIF